MNRMKGWKDEWIYEWQSEPIDKGMNGLRNEQMDY